MVGLCCSTNHRLAGPIEVHVCGESVSVIEVLEELAQILVVRCLEEIQTPDVAQIRRHLLRMSAAQHLDRRGSLRVADLLVALLKGLRLEALPWQTAPQKVHEHVTERLQVVSPALLCFFQGQFAISKNDQLINYYHKKKKRKTFSKMSVDAHVSRGAGETLVFPVRYVFVRLQVYVFFGQSEVNDMNNLVSLRRGPTDQKVLRLNVPVYQMSTVHVFYPVKLEKKRKKNGNFIFTFLFFFQERFAIL